MDREDVVAFTKSIASLVEHSDEIDSATFNVVYEYQEIPGNIGIERKDPTGWMNLDVKIRCKNFANKTLKQTETTGAADSE